MNEKLVILTHTIGANWLYVIDWLRGLTSCSINESSIKPDADKVGGLVEARSAGSSNVDSHLFVNRYIKGAWCLTCCKFLVESPDQTFRNSFHYFQHVVDAFCNEW